MNESSLFQGVTVYISGDPDKKVLDIFKNGKGQISKFTIEKATHVLCGRNYDESHIQEVRELYVKPVVNEKWILDSFKLNKLASSKAYSPSSQDKLFNNLIFTMTLIEQSDRLKLYAMITLHGGVVQKVFDNKVTHLIAGGTNTVALKLAGIAKATTIVTPDWVIECLKNRKLIEADIFHPNLLVTVPMKQQKITMISTHSSDLKSPSIIRNQLQQNVRPARPMVVQMQHTPQQINEIIQSQIQQQQMQEQAKLRAAQAASSSSSSLISGSSSSSQTNQHLGGQVTQTITATTATLLSQSAVGNNNEHLTNQVSGSSILQVNQIQKIPTTQQQQQQPQMNIPSSNVGILQPNQQQQQQSNVAQIQQMQMNVNVQQINQGNLQQQRQISLQQQLENTARNQKIQLISQQLQQSTQNQQQLLAQQQQIKQFQNSQIISGNTNISQVGNLQQQQQIVVNQNQQQFISSVQNTVPQNQIVSVPQSQQQAPQSINQQFGNQTMKQILTTTSGQSQNQNQPQFILNQNPNIKTIGAQQSQLQGQQQQQPTPQQPGQHQSSQGGNYIQIIQQGQQIIQIQHPENNQLHQKSLNQSIQQQQAPQNIQINQQQIQNAPNVAIQPSGMPNSQMNPNIGGNLQQTSQQQQVPSSPSALPSAMLSQQQAAGQQSGIIQNQGGRQNIVIINQLQNAQNINQMALQNQRFQSPQGQFQKTHIGTQQIIQQKLLTSNEGLHPQTTQAPQIIQVHSALPPGGGINQQQQNVDVIHNPQTSQQQNQALTQAQAVQQIAQQLQSGSAEIISQQHQQQLTQIQQPNQQMNIIPSQTASHPVPGQIQAQSRQWIPQSPTQQQQQQQQTQSQQGQQASQGQGQTPQSPIIQQTVVQQHIITANPQTGVPGQQQQQQQFIRASGPRLGPIYLDAQSSLQFQRMDQAQRQEYLEQLHNKQQQQQREGVMFQQRAPPGANPGPRPQHHIVIRSQVPPGLTPQQQLQWLNQRRQILIRQPNQVGMAQINQPGVGGPNQQQLHNVTQIQIDPNATPQQQQLQRQQHFQRLQQLQQQQQNQKMQANAQTPVSPRTGGVGFQSSVEGVMDGMPQQVSQQLVVSNDANGVSSAKTKTALANMLSNRLGGNNGNVVPMGEQSAGVVEQSAAGTLRMMTAQHNALNVQGMTPSVVRTPQEMIVLQQQQQQIQTQIPGGQAIVQTHQQLQQRRTLGNITNAQGAGVVVPTSPVILGNQMTPQVIMPQSPSTNQLKAQPPFSPGRAPPQIVNRPQFYGHNPNLKLPLELFLLGCYFLIVEYDETNSDELEDWKKSIQYHGGEIEACYNLKVTHVLCRTQKHGIVMQAIRDNKRCITAYWLNDIILKKQVIPPWQAIHFPSSAVFGSLKPGMKHIITIMGFENDERERVKRMIEESGAKLTTYLNRQNTVVVCKRLDQANKKYIHAKEFTIPMVNVCWLSDLLLGNTSLISQFDSSKYQQYNLPQPLKIDHTILPQLMNAWKAPINLTQEANEKRSQMEPPIKRAKKMRTIPYLESIPDEISCIRQPDPNQIPIVMFSHVDNFEGLNRTVMILGGRMAQDYNEMTHLVMTKPNRTIKFLNALCTAKYILNSAWLEDSAKCGYFQCEENYWIKDLVKENFKCDIPAVVKSPLRNRLFENRVFYITPSVMPAPSFLRYLIEQSGGKWEHNRRSVMKIHELNQQSPNSYIVVSCPEDLNLLGFKHYVCYVCTSEFILQAIMTQTIDFLKSELQLSR